MRVTKVVLGLAGILLISLVFVSFQAAAHPDQSDAGIANAELHGAGAPVGNHISDQGRANGGFPPNFENEHSNAGVAIGNNPLCPLHPNPADH